MTRDGAELLRSLLTGISEDERRRLVHAMRTSPGDGRSARHAGLRQAPETGHGGVDVSVAAAPAPRRPEPDGG